MLHAMVPALEMPVKRLLLSLSLLPLLLLGACDQDVLMRGYVEVAEPGGGMQKVHMVCRRIYDPDSHTLTLTGVTLPVDSVIKPQLGGLSMGATAQAVSDQIRGIDLQQIALCESIILDPAQPDIRQAFKDYIGVDGYLTEQIRTLNSSTTPEQYQDAAETLIRTPATVAPSTAAAVQDAASSSSSVARLQAPPLQTFPVQPALSSTTSLLLDSRT